MNRPRPSMRGLWWLGPAWDGRWVGICVRRERGSRSQASSQAYLVRGAARHTQATVRTDRSAARRTPHAVGSFNPHRTRRGDGVPLPDLTSKEVGVHRRGGTWPLSLDWSLRHGARAPAAGPRFVTSPCAWLTPSVTTALKHGPGLTWRHQGSGGRCVAGTAARADAARAPLDSETQNVAPPPCGV